MKIMIQSKPTGAGRGRQVLLLAALVGALILGLDFHW
jgi:hypothetical protein